MEDQKYSNQKSFVPGYHIRLALLLTMGFVASVFNVVRALQMAVGMPARC